MNFYSNLQDSLRVYKVCSEKVKESTKFHEPVINTQVSTDLTPILSETRKTLSDNV